MKPTNDYNKLLKLGVVLLGGILSLLSLYLSYQIQYGEGLTAAKISVFIGSVIWVFIAFIVINMLFGTYIFYNKTLMDLFYLTMLSHLVLSVFMMSLSFIGNWLTFPRTVILINFIVGMIILFLFNALMYKLYQHLRGQKTIMVVGQENRVLEAVKNFDLMKNRRHEVTHVVLSNYYDNVMKYIDHVDIVYLTGYIKESERLKIFEYLMHTNKKLFLSTNFEHLMMVNPNIMNFEDESIIEVSNFEISAEDDIVKRIVDMVISFLLLVITSPIMVVTAIAIKLDSPGDILYKQERVTKNHRHFKILKFRSMSQTAEAQTGPVLAASQDSRVTKVGKVIRASRIDELPQLINVLLGDMSLVGPRPERPFFVEQFKAANPYYSLRHHVRAGITGYAQVYGKYSTDFNNKLNFDLLYIKNYSLAFDFKLLFQTVKILFDKVSSRGIDEVKGKMFSWDDYAEKIMIIK